MSLADRWPHVIEMENNNVHNSAANTGRTLVGSGRAVQNAAAGAAPALKQGIGLSMRKEHRSITFSPGFTLAFLALSPPNHLPTRCFTPCMPPVCNTLESGFAVAGEWLEIAGVDSIGRLRGKLVANIVPAQDEKLQ